MTKTQHAPITTRHYYPWLVWGLGAAFFFCEYLTRVVPSIMAPELMRALRVNAFELGALSAFFHFSYVSMQIPVGALVDRYPSRWLLSINCALCGLATIAFSYATTLSWAEILRFLIGLGGAFSFVGAMKLASTYFPARRFGLLAGLTQALGMLGAAVADGGLSFSVQAIGWQMTVVLIGCLLIMLSILIVLVVRDSSPSSHTDQSSSTSSEQQFPLWKGLWMVLCTRQSWVNGIYVAFLYATTEAFAELWGVPYLRRVHHLSNTMAGTAISLIFLGWTIGGPLAGWLSDRWGKRRPVMMLSSALSLLMMSLVLYAPYHSFALLSCFLFAYGLCNTGVGVSYALSGEINARRISGVSVAFANMASVLIGALGQPVMGWLLDQQNLYRVRGHLLRYSIHSFQVTMLLLPACIFISLIAVFFIKETYCSHKVED